MWTDGWIGFVLVLCAGSSVAMDPDDVQHFTNNWIVHVSLGPIAAHEVAKDLDMQYVGPDTGNDGFYRMTHNQLSPMLYDHHEAMSNRITNHDLVTIAIQESVKKRSLRGTVPPSSKLSNLNNWHKAHSPEMRRSNYAYSYSDPRWLDLWYFQDLRSDPSQPVVDINVVPVLLGLQITGKGVNITVPDDGLEWTNADIRPRFKPELSWNYITNTDNIMPDRDADGNMASHGTRCCGEIIMQPNDVCGVGTAYGANIGGIKFLDGRSNDAREAKVLKHALQYVDIYSNSWGPADTGDVMESLPMHTTKMSLSKGIHEGRDGKGVVYVFAAGNGKADGDNCACDGYVNSIYTIVVASCDDSGHVTYYSERCAAIMVTAYSGSGLTRNVLTTDVNNGCTDQHTGTSAAAPLVSGIIALTIEANRKLGWRDIQYLLAWTSQVAPISDNLGWNRNMAGFYYSVDFGFGMVNALYMVKQAQTWKNVPEMSSCGIRLPKVVNFPVSRNSGARIIVNSTGCENMSGEVKYMEAVQLVLSMTYPKRGDIQIAMRSPLGTEVHVLENRPKDNRKRGLRKWTFTVLAFWGETPKGNFIIDIYDTTGPSTNRGKIDYMSLSIHGTKEMPDVYKDGVRSYDKFTLPNPKDQPRFAHLSDVIADRSGSPDKQEPAAEPVPMMPVGVDGDGLYADPTPEELAMMDEMVDGVEGSAMPVQNDGPPANWVSNPLQFLTSFLRPPRFL